MDQNSRNIIDLAKKYVIFSIVVGIVMGIIEGNGMIYMLFIFAIAGVDVWIYFKLINSYDTVIVEVLSHQSRLSSQQATMNALKKDLKTLEKNKETIQQKKNMIIELQKRMEYLEDNMRLINQKVNIPQEELSAETEKQNPSQGTIGLAEGYVQCPNPQCKEIQLADHDKCWKCGTSLL